MSADQTPGRPTEQEWAEAAAASAEVPIWAFSDPLKHLAPLIARVEAAARAEAAASVAGPVLALADEWEHPSRPAASTWQRQAAAHLRAAIPTEAVEALAQVKADAKADALREATDERWDTAVDWLLNHHSVASDDPGHLFWAFYDGLITEDELRAEATGEEDSEGMPTSLHDVLIARRIAREAQQGGGDR